MGYEKKTILTEKRNPNSINIDLMDTKDILKTINNEDLKVAKAVNTELDEITKAVDLISEKFLIGGKLFYFGAGTSGRLGVLDASECPPTFGVSPDMVQGYIAGGDRALRDAVEGAEDSADLAKDDFNRINPSCNDIIVAISASGNATYVKTVLELAKNNNISTVGIACNKKASMRELCDVFISPEVGEEIITGSTRMKAGTAQKMVLNMLTTASMVKIGKTYENYMIDVKPTNTKLIDRATRIISEIASVNYKLASTCLKKSNFNVKTAIVMILHNLSKEEASSLLEKYNGKLRNLIAEEGA